MSVDAPTSPISAPSGSADDLTATNIVDPLANEQTWPTEEEMRGPGSSAGPSEVRRTKRVPKGTSAYQAAWIFDDEDEEEEDEEDDEDQGDDDEVDMDNEEQVPQLIDNEAEETEEIELDSRKGETHRDLDPEQEQQE